MSVIKKLATNQNISNDEPNKELAKEIADKEDNAGINELTEALNDENDNIKSDAIKTLYEVGYIKPELIKDKLNEFVNLLKSKNNRLIWGAMIAISTFSKEKAKELGKYTEVIAETMKKGSVITMDAGMVILSNIASASKELSDKVFPVVLEFFKNARPKDIPSYIEKMLPAISKENVSEVIKSVKDRAALLTETQMKRVKKALKKINIDL